MNHLAEARLQCAIKAARAAGAIIKNRFGTAFDVEYKSHQDPVTEVDRACERQIREILSKDFPEIEIWGEEFGTTDPDADLLWIVDPLDGTKNFVHGYPFVAVSIALVERSRSILGVVYDPVRDELFTALRGQGARLNGHPIKVSETENLSEALVVTTLSIDPAQQADLILKACTYCQGVRRGGAAALDLCQVAAGRLDTVWEWSLRPWDLAAASLIIEEAEGTVTKPDGSPFEIRGGSILASNTNLHRKAVTLLNQ